VVGAGVVGLAAADALARAGVDVRCFEGAEPGSGQSAGQTRVFRHVHDRADLVALATRSRRGWDGWSERAGEPLIADEGVLFASPDAAPDVLSQTLDVLHHLVLPCVTLLAVFYAQYMLIMRSSLLGEMNADYLTTARAKGLRDDLVRRRHAVPNALLPTTTLVFMQFGMVVSGAVSVEAVFSWPGLGQLTYQSLHGPDLPVLQGVFVVLAGAVVLMNLLAELLYRVLDPRVRTS